MKVCVHPVFKSIQTSSSMKSGSKPEAYYLLLCKKMVEEKLGWGSSDNWSHADFVEISEKISEATKINLSVTTIKRLWGKVNYSGSPSGSTLNALALYLGYENWRSFKLDQGEGDIESPATAQEAAASAAVEEPVAVKDDNTRRNNKRLLVPFFTLLLVCLAAALFYAGKEKEVAPLAAAKIVFNSEPLAKGIPNTVVFNYDLSAFDFDSAFIQQDWDARKRQQISKENKQHTSVYYYPGHFNAKLVINDQVVKEHGLLVPTEGWLGFVEREGYKVPVYILPDKLIEQGALHVSPKVLEANKVDTGKDFGMSYANARDFGVEGDNFTLEAAVKNSMEEGGQLCQEVMILIDGASGVMWFPLSAPGCVGNLSLNFGEVHVSGKNQDLSAFGADLSRWNQVKCVVKDKNVSLFLNDSLVQTLTYKQSVGKVMGINFKFRGAGAVDYVRLLNGADEVVYSDEFDQVQ